LFGTDLGGTQDAPTNLAHFVSPLLKKRQMTRAEMIRPLKCSYVIARIGAWNRSELPPAYLTVLPAATTAYEMDGHSGGGELFPKTPPPTGTR
jgi:hypothetical protein